MNHRHSEPFYISPKLFDNRRLKRRRCRWLERLRDRQQFYITQALACKTDRGQSVGQRRRGQLRRRVAAALPADITIDLLSDEDNEQQSQSQPLYVQPPPVSLQLSMVPNITLVPVSMAVSSNNMLLMPASNYSNYSDAKRQRKAPKPRRRQGQVIVLTSDEEMDMDMEMEMKLEQSPHQPSRPVPPLAPLSVLSETVEEVTVSLVPRNATTASCYQRRQQRLQPRHSPHYHNHNSASASNPNSCSTPSSSCTRTSSLSALDGLVDGCAELGGLAATLPDETTVHTVIANRIYELSLSKLREGLASSGVPEYAQDLLPDQLQKISPALRAKMAPLMAPSPPAPISLKLSSDLSISLISDDDEGDAAGGGGGGGNGVDLELVHPVVAAEAHAAAKLLKQQQPQLSVVQHLQYAGLGQPVALALPIMPIMPAAAQAAAAAALPASTAPTPRRRKLG